MITNEEMKKIIDRWYSYFEPFELNECIVSRTECFNALKNNAFKKMYIDSMWESFDGHSSEDNPIPLLTLLKINERFPHPDPEVQKYIHPTITINENPIHVIFVDSLIQALLKEIDNKAITYEQFKAISKTAIDIASDKAKEKNLNIDFIKNALAEIDKKYNAYKDKKDSKEQPAEPVEESKQEQPKESIENNTQQDSDDNNSSEVSNSAEEETYEEKIDNLKDAIIDTADSITTDEVKRIKDNLGTQISKLEEENERLKKQLNANKPNHPQKDEKKSSKDQSEPKKSDNNNQPKQEKVNGNNSQSKDNKKSKDQQNKPKPETPVKTEVKEESVPEVKEQQQAQQSEIDKSLIASPEHPIPCVWVDPSSGQMMKQNFIDSNSLREFAKNCINNNIQFSIEEN